MMNKDEKMHLRNSIRLSLFRYLKKKFPIIFQSYFVTLFRGNDPQLWGGHEK